MRSRWSVRCLAAAILALLPACGDREPVRIGFVGGLSGRFADLGIAGRDGATLAVEEWNRRGGVRGRPIELLVRSDEHDPGTALTVDRELIGLGVDAIVGHMTSAMAEAARPLAEQARVPFISPTVTTTSLTGLDDQFLRVTATTREYATRVAEHLRRRRGLSAVAAVLDLGNASYTESWLGHFRERFEQLGGRVAAVEPIDTRTGVRFEELARRIARGDVDGVVLVVSALDAAMIAQQLRKVGSRLPLAGAEWASTEKLLELGGRAVEGMLVSQFFDRTSPAPRYQAFRAAYRERFGEEPGFAAVNAYDAVGVVLRGLEARRDGESLKEAIVRVGTFDGLQGPLAIDRFGDAGRSSRLAVVDGGAFKVLEEP